MATKTQCSGVALCFALLLASGCAADPAPEPITDLSQWLWRNYDVASDERMTDAVVALNGVATPVTASGPLRLLTDELTGADLLITGRKDTHANKAIGILVVTEITCTLAQIEKVHTAPEQASLHPDSFTAYKRTYAQSRDAFVAGNIALLDWTTVIASEYGNGTLIASIRRVPDLGDEMSPFGAALVGRTWLRESATGADWPQDYQAEAYFERTPGRVVHLLATWREARFVGMSMSTSFLQNIMMDSFVAWDEEVGKACRSGKY